MFMKFLMALFALLLLPAIADAADITGVPKIREADHIQIGNARIRLGGIDAPAGAISSASTPRASAGLAGPRRATS